MSDKNNNVMMNNDMNNNMNNDNDPKERMRKKVKKAAGIALCAVLAGGLAAGSFEGINTLTGWNSSTVEAAPKKRSEGFQGCNIAKTGTPATLQCSFFGK